MDPGHFISMLLGWAVVVPLCSFFVILVFGPRMGKAGQYAGNFATAAIAASALLSFASLAIWLSHHRPSAESHGEEHASLVSPAANIVVRGQEPHDAGHAAADAHVEAAADDTHGGAATTGHAGSSVRHYTGDYNAPAIGGPWVLGQFGELRLSISYYIDALTVCMFCMVTFIATLIHIYATGYMHDDNMMLLVGLLR